MKKMLIILSIVAILSFCFWRFFIYYEIPPQENFIGMTREQVIEWVDKNGRMTYLGKDHTKYNSIYIKIGPSNLYFDNKNEILKNKSVMKEPVWDIGWRALRSDVWFAWRVRFENDVVVENTYTMIFDGP